MVPETEMVLRTITGGKGILAEGLTATAETDAMSRQPKLPAQNVERNVKFLSNQLQASQFIATIVLERKARRVLDLLKEILT